METNDLMPTVGQKVRFDPFKQIGGHGAEAVSEVVTGTVVAVNEKHRWFSVEYGKLKQRTSFKFCDIGKDVKVL